MPRPGLLHFEVEDTGCGIAPDNLELIFEPFEQVGMALLRPGGTGLGLSISRQLVAKMGGQLCVTSHPEQGSSFWFELPLNVLEPVPSEVPARPLIAGYAGARKRLLVVDDMLANRELLVDWLAPLGFELDQAADGREALACAAASPPDLVLMDCVMPVMDGVEATRRLRATPGLESVPVIAISAAALHDDERRSLEAGASAFVRKPIDLDALLDRIGGLLGLSWLGDAAQRDAAAATAAPALVPPRHDEMIVLHRLAQRGNMREIRAFAEQLADREPGMRPFAQRLLELADAYQPTAILRLVTAHL
jgi:CheY-like chemotaxis protein